MRRRKRKLTDQTVDQARAEVIAALADLELYPDPDDVDELSRRTVTLEYPNYGPTR
jgi:hypothetical protein